MKGAYCCIAIEKGYSKHAAQQALQRTAKVPGGGETARSWCIPEEKNSDEPNEWAQSGFEYAFC
jgi:hypothetical protein